MRNFELSLLTGTCCELCPCSCEISETDCCWKSFHFFSALSLNLRRQSVNKRADGLGQWEQTGSVPIRRDYSGSLVFYLLPHMKCSRAVILFEVK